MTNAKNAARDIDPELLGEYAKSVFGALGGAMTSAMIYLGDRLGGFWRRTIRYQSVLPSSPPTNLAT